MRRRESLKAVVAAMLGAGSSVSWGQAPATATGEGPALRPYLQVKPVAGEQGVVRAYFSPSCSFSRAYFSFFKNLEATLPSDRRFAFSPLINKGDGVGYALAFEAVATHYPAFVDNFVQASMLAVQERGMGPSNWRAIERIGKAARLPVALPALVQANEGQLMRAVEADIRRQTQLGITNTPSVAVGGTYVVTPEFANGDPAQFSRLVNGIISMAG